MNDTVDQEPHWFFLIGAPKAATTTICRHLREHPQVAFSTRDSFDGGKETGFFNRDELYALGMDYYWRFFPSVGPKTRAIGEGSVRYSLTSLYPETPARIAQFAPKARIVYGVRHPLDRIRSYARQKRANGTVDPRSSLFEIIRDVPDIIDSALYATQARNYLRYFDRDQILIYLFDEFERHPSGVLAAIAGHLGIDPDSFPTDMTLRINTAEEKTQDSVLLWRLRDLKTLRRSMPRRLRRLIRGRLEARLGVPMPPDPWEPEAIEWVRCRIEADVVELLSILGRPPDYWTWEPQQARAHNTDEI